MYKYLDVLTLTASTDYAKENNLLAKQYVSVVKNNLKYPTVILSNKKSKNGPTLIENDCITDDLRDNKFTIEFKVPWRYAKHILFSFKEATQNEETNHDKTTQSAAENNISKLPDLKLLCEFLRRQLFRHHAILISGMKVRLNYLTQKFIFTVEQTTPYLHPGTEHLLNVGYMCMGGIQIDIVPHKILKNKSKNLLAFNHFAGYESEINNLKETIENYQEGSSSVSGILISGMSGTGKSFLCNILKAVFENNCAVYGSEDIISSIKGETESVLKKIFQRANERVPFVLVIDNIDEICSGRDEDVTNTRIVNAFLHLIDSGHVKQRALVIATASKPDLLDQALRRPGRLSHDIVLNIPDEKNRLLILKCILKNSSQLDADNFLEEIAAKTSGFVAADLIKLITEASSYSKESLPTRDYILQALNVIKPSALKNIATSSNNVSMEDILNCEEIKTSLINLFDVTLRRRDIFLASDVTIPSRILLFGPTGCGKTMLTQALAHRFNLNVIVVKRSHVFGKYFGESEKNLSLIFERAEKSSPCILHFENFTAIAGKKSRDAEVSNDVEGRVINHLKVLLDGVRGFESIYVLAETNRPDLLDQNVIRHGRFHKYVFVDLPSLQDRRCILEQKLKSVQWDLEPESSWSLDELAKETKGFSVAEMNLLCNEILSSLEVNINDETTNLEMSYVDNSITTSIESALEDISPSNTSKMMKKHKEFASIYCRSSC